MSHAISFNFVASVKGGPSISENGTMEVPVYSVTNLSVPATGSAILDISPDAAGQLLVIKADVYEKLTYTVTGGVTAELDAPHILLGSGAVGLLNGGNPVETITFNNAATEDAEVTVMLGREAS